MTQFIVICNNEDKVVDQRMIKIQRLMNDNQSKNIYIDIRKPKEPITDITVKFWNADGNKMITIGQLKVESFDEE